MHKNLYTALTIVTIVLLIVSLNIGTPGGLSMLQNYPNPCREQTIFKYRTTENSHVDLSIFDMNKEKIVTLVNQTEQAGTHEVIWNATNVSNGVYIASLSSDSRIIQAIKILVVK